MSSRGFDMELGREWMSPPEHHFAGWAGREDGLGQRTDTSEEIDLAKMVN